MTRPFLPFFNPSRPVFIKQDGIQLAGKIWKKGERFNWEFFATPHEVIQQLFFKKLQLQKFLLVMVLRNTQ